MPVVLVDWSDVREQLRHLTLRAYFPLVNTIHLSVIIPSYGS